MPPKAKASTAQIQRPDAQRLWDAKKHYADDCQKSWAPLCDDYGHILPGVFGRKGVRGERKDGSFIGADLISMAPGSRFPMHTHEGDHEIYFIQGKGFVSIDGEDIAVKTGDLIHIPAEYPHAVWVPVDAPRLLFVAMGHPHHPVHSHQRMKSLEGS